MSQPVASPTLLSTVQKFASPDAFPTNTLHPFASSSESSSALLRKFLDATNSLSHSLNVHLNQPLSNTKLVSLLRQHAAISNTLYQSDQNIQQTLRLLRQRSGTTYIEDIPLTRSLIPSFCISRLETWGTSIGMESFREEEKLESEGRITLVLGGKVLVVDIDMSINRSDASSPVLSVVSAKTSYAVPSGGAGTTSTNTGGSTLLDGFLVHSISAFLEEALKHEEKQDCLEAARLGKVISSSLAYLMMLDGLAAPEVEGDTGLRWFGDVDQLSSLLLSVAKSEEEAISRSLSLKPTPLDIYLLRAHALPLPYLTSPTISFLVYISPLVYLTLLRTSTTTANSRSPQTSSTTDLHPNLDIPLPDIRSYLTTHPQSRGVTLATLSLVEQAEPQIHMQEEVVGMPPLTSRPTFALLSDSDADHIFPQPQAVASAEGDSATQIQSDPKNMYRWTIDFTSNGQHPGVVMTQSRMHEIEIIVNPLGGVGDMSGVGMMSFGGGSWVDLLLNPNPTNLVSPERYTALYTSPTSAHPPLQLRLTAPEEPGFVLEKVQVRSMREIWGILEVVKEQSWLNEILLGCQWTPEGLTTMTMVGANNEGDMDDEDGEATEEDLQAVLNGTIVPRKMPINVYIPSTADPDPAHHPLFDSTTSSFLSASRSYPKIIMTAPERPPIPGLVEICVSYDPERERGVGVRVMGAMESESVKRVDVLEEVCRRGGVLGLAGRVWAGVKI